MEALETRTFERPSSDHIQIAPTTHSPDARWCEVHILGNHRAHSLIATYRGKYKCVGCPTPLAVASA
eukprot:scaffold116438_cov33-Tisochrysis_lutea.AAC.3